MRYVLDPSVALKVVLPEADSARAVRLRDDYANGVHNVEPFHLIHYLDEENFRYNKQKHSSGKAKTDGERFIDVAAGIGEEAADVQKLTGKTPECLSAP